MAARWLFALLLALAVVPQARSLEKLQSSNQRAAQLMVDGDYAQAAKLLEKSLIANPTDTTTHFRLGICLLKLGDLKGADDHLTDAVHLTPNLSDEAATAWKEEGAKALKAGRVERASAMYSKAVSHRSALGPALGRELLLAAGNMGDAAARARTVVRITPWVGSKEATDASALYFTKKFGPPRLVQLDSPGWSELARVKPGDELHYLSSEPVREKDSGALRILPAAPAAPVKLLFDEKDMGGNARTTVYLARHENPARVYVWLIPGG